MQSGLQYHSDFLTNVLIKNGIKDTKWEKVNSRHKERPLHAHKLHHENKAGVL